MPISSITVAILASLMAWLGLRTALWRLKSGVSLGEGEDNELQRRVRAFGNLAEYAPMSLILLALVEYQQAWTSVTLLLAMILLLSRILHAYAFLQNKGAAHHFKPRKIAMILQFIFLWFGAACLVILSL